ncbi:Hypothetical predicted protein, partial [Olea europaea subsp. europaea]
VLVLDDWVWSIAHRDAIVVSMAGSDVYIWDSNNKSKLMVVCNARAEDNCSDRIVCGGEEGVVRSGTSCFTLRGLRLENRTRRWKVQTAVNSKGGSTEHCSFAAKKNQMNGNTNEYGITEKLEGLAVDSSF